MVDKDKIRQLWIEYFDTDQDTWRSGDVTINPDGSVSVDDSVWLLKNTTSLPIKLKKIEGNFDASHSDLDNLTNFPDYVASDLELRNNYLTHLLGAPAFVGNDLLLSGNPLRSLVGFPAHVGGTVSLDWNEHLPLLRVLLAKNTSILGNNKVHKILQKYAGQGKRAMFDAQKSLEDAGFSENARW
jgi:hypothetical protein